MTGLRARSRRGALGAASLLVAAACAAEGDARSNEGEWRMVPQRSRYTGTAEARIEETFSCASESASLRCRITAVRANGETTRATFEATPGEGAGTVSGVEGVDRVLLMAREDGYDAIFLARTEPVLGYRIVTYDDSMIVRTTDARTGELLDTRIVYVRR